MRLEAADLEALRPLIAEEVARAIKRNGPEWETTEQFGRRIGIAPGGVVAGIKSGLYPGVKHGRWWVNVKKHEEQLRREYDASLRKRR